METFGESMDNIVRVPNSSLYIANYTRLDTKDLVALLTRIESVVRKAELQLWYETKGPTRFSDDPASCTLYFAHLPADDERAKQPRSWNTVMPMELGSRMLVRIADLPTWPESPQDGPLPWRPRLAYTAYQELATRLASLYGGRRTMKSARDAAAIILPLLKKTQHTAIYINPADPRYDPPTRASLEATLEMRYRALREWEAAREYAHRYHDRDYDCTFLGDSLQALGVPNDIVAQAEGLTRAIADLNNTMRKLKTDLDSLDLRLPSPT